MEITGKQEIVMTIDPEEVIQNLLKRALRGDEGVMKSNGKYYRVRELQVGPHLMTEYDNISKKEYKYVRALELVQETVSNPFRQEAKEKK